MVTRPPARLGCDIQVDTLGTGPGAAFAYTNTMAGYSVVISPGDGVAIIYVTKREKGDIDSVRVGDESAAVLRRCGKPTTVGGPNALWVVGDGVVLIELGKGDRAVRIGIGRAAERRHLPGPV